jgi:hypothetical protein
VVAHSNNELRSRRLTNVSADTINPAGDEVVRALQLIADQRDAFSDIE